jgi:hypothetical protein
MAAIDMIRFLSVIALVISMPASVFSAGRLSMPDIVVGQSLAATTNVRLSEAAPAGGLQLTVTSGNPSLVLLSKTPEAAGSASIVVKVEEGRTVTPDLYIYGLVNSGTTNYSASALGYGNCSGTVRLASSGIVIQGSYGLGNPMLMTTGSEAPKITVHSALIGPAGEYVTSQPVAGGLSVAVNITNSNPQVGTVTPATVTIASGSASATARFKPSSAGNTTLSAGVPPAFSVVSQHGMVSITIISPGIGVVDQVSIGRDLQLGGTLSLGQSAPPAGLQVVLTSNNPEQLLLSRSAHEPGQDSITIDIPAGGTNGLYYLQALSDTGTAAYTASAPGYVSRIGKVRLTPSGVVIGLGPPDEAEVFRKEASEYEHGLSISLSHDRGFPLTVYMEQLDPVTYRGADITVQALRPGVSATVELKISDPAVGIIGSPVSIKSGSSSAVMPFSARKEGSTVISAAPPIGFTPASNSTSLTVVVTP